MDQGLATFDTPIGACSLAWGANGLIGVRLPERDAAASEAWMARRFPAATRRTPPAPVRAAIEAMRALLEGEAVDLGFIALDLDTVPDFNRRVYLIAREIPPGETVTYGAIAAKLGGVAQSRAVGKALGENPWPIVVPCHRVLAAGGGVGGFSAPGGVQTKARMLAIERARTGPEPGLFDAGETFSLAPRRKS